MKLGYLAFKNLVSKPLNLLLSLMLLSLSVSLVTFVLQLSQQLGGQLSKNIAPFDMVIGAKGSPLQLVLSSVLHVDAPTGNINLKDAAVLKKHPFVQTAIPVSYGDNYKGYRILGTEANYLDHYNAELLEGMLFEKPFEVVAGHHVAHLLNLNIGDTFVSSHGLASGGTEVHDEHLFTIKGILKPSGTVVDQLLVTNLESIWLAHDHEEHSEEEEHIDKEDHAKESGNHQEHDHHGEDHDHEEAHLGDEHHEEKEITSLLVKFKSPLGMVQLPRFINENTSMQAALPGFEVQRLMRLLGSGVQTINGIALAILLVSGLSIFISLLKTIRERKQELALLRTYGLRTGQLLGLALLEGLFLALIGFVLGWLLGRLGIWVVSRYMQNEYGYGLQINAPEQFEFYLLGLILVLTTIATMLASRSIFKLNVAKTLSDV
ncbi:ABC transporter permease [Flagellimonas flava]|uniref:Putative ABC transport system permease protein n=1 Tax=Flagellimonas flava TaxID=570519 RepID=A0A1M5LUP1_9FLAO|nr:FtsX-like permease family protein [Allomuricauda flava]SHG68842.1 putative ABC transport system permease protein [Allomuricauda flava]